MAQPEIQKRLKAMGEQQAQATGITRDRVLARAAEMAFAKPPEGSGYGTHDVKALELAAKLAGIYTDQKTVNHNHSISLAEEQELLRKLRILTEQAKRLGIEIPAEPILIEGNAELIDG